MNLRRTNLLVSVFALGCLAPSGSVTASAQQDYFSNWPAGTAPREVGKRVAEHFLTSPHQCATIFYGEVGTWYGALTFAHLTSDRDLQEKLNRYDALLPSGSETTLIGKR